MHNFGLSTESATSRDRMVRCVALSGRMNTLFATRLHASRTGACLLAGILFALGCDESENDASSTTSSTTASSTTKSEDTTNTSDEDGEISSGIEVAGMDTCVAEITSFSDLDAVTPAGVSGRDVLARALGIHPVILKVDSPRAFLTVLPDSAQGNGEIEITYADQGVRHLHQEVVECTASSCNDLGVICLDGVEVDVDVQVRSADGALQERWPATLFALDINDPDLGLLGESVEKASIRAELSLRFDTLAFAGGIQVAARAPAGWTLTGTSARFYASFESGHLAESSLDVEISSVMGDGDEGLASIGSENIYRFEPVDTRGVAARTR